MFVFGFFFHVQIVGGPADGRLLPGDQVLKVNNKAIEDLSPEYVDNMIRYKFILLSLNLHSNVHLFPPLQLEMNVTFSKRAVT